MESKEIRKYIDFIKREDGVDDYQLSVFMPEKFKNAIWYITDPETAEEKVLSKGPDAGPLPSSIVMLGTIIKEKFEGKWLCSRYELDGKKYNKQLIYLTYSISDMIRKNRFDVVSFYTAASGYPRPEAKYFAPWHTYTSVAPNPRNRWYVNTEMLPRLQDVVLICKGWYNKERYDSEYEALQAYWAKLAAVEPEDIGYDAVLQCLLLPACEAFLSPRQFCEIFYDRIFKQDIGMQDYRKYVFHKDDSQEMNCEYLIDLLINALFKLKKDEYRDVRELEEGYCVI